MNRPRLYDGETFQHRGYTFRVRFERDDTMGEPWKEHDGHGIVSDWTRREKRPGERVLVEDRGSRRFYDVAGTMPIARRDGWGCGDDSHRHTSPGETAACAVDRDFEHLRRWCADQWEWTIVSVRVVDSYLKNRTALGGVESDDDGRYLTEIAYELADGLMSEIEVAEPNIVLSEN